MGKWNHRRWITRKKYYHQQTPPSPPSYYETEHKFRGAWKNTAFPWEERFCISVGIPWQKVVIAKKYMYCHDNVVKWNDSAGEETFLHAKKRFWAEINGLPCDVHLPDPDMYIDEIDWNTEIDPELIMDLDRAYFDPVEKVLKENINKKELHSLVPSCNSGLHDENPSTCDNPWECRHSQGDGAIEDVEHGWDRWDKSKNENSHNPWERKNSQDGRAMRIDTWGDGADKSRDRDQGLAICTGQIQRLDKNCGNRWDYGSQSENPWNHWKTNAHELRNSSCVGTHGGAPENRPWRDSRGDPWIWQRWENQCNVPNQLDYRRHNESGRASNGSCRKREGSQQYTSRYKSLRLQADDYGTIHQWRNQRTPRRISFA